MNTLWVGVGYSCNGVGMCTLRGCAALPCDFFFLLTVAVRAFWVKMLNMYSIFCREVIHLFLGVVYGVTGEGCYSTWMISRTTCVSASLE